jgi:hypothetical protein
VDLLEDRGLDRRHLALICSRRWAFWRFNRDAARAFLRFLAAVRSFTRAWRARWPMDWIRLHLRRTSPSPPGRLYAGARRDPIQPGHEGNL